MWDGTYEGIPFLELKRTITVVALWLLRYLRQLHHFTHALNHCSYSSCKIRSRDKSSPEDLIAPRLSFSLSTFIPEVFKARGGVMGNLIWWMMSLSMAGGWS